RGVSEERGVHQGEAEVNFRVKFRPPWRQCQMWSWSFTIVSADEPSIVHERIASALTTKRPPFLSDQLRFRGWKIDDGFEIRRNHFVMERYFPVVAMIKIHSANNGTIVDVRTFPELWNVVCLCLFSACGLVFTIGFELVQPTGSPLSCLVPFVLVWV